MTQSARDLWDVNVPEWAASLAFYAVLSLFPLLIVAMVAASYLADVHWATEQAIGLLGHYLPEGEGTIEETVNNALARRRPAGIISLVVLILMGRRILGGLDKGLNLVSDVNVRDEPIKRRIVVEVCLGLGLMGMMLLALASPRLGDFAAELVQRIPGPDGIQLTVTSALVRVVLLLTAFTLVYAYVPRGRRHWRSVLIGAAVASALFLIALGIFSLVLDPLWRTFSLVYGPIAIAALLMTWSWYVALITLAGGAVASHVKVMVLEGQPAGIAHAEHVEGAS